jgi:hypothetical protein
LLNSKLRRSRECVNQKGFDSKREWDEKKKLSSPDRLHPAEKVSPFQVRKWRDYKNLSLGSKLRPDNPVEEATVLMDWFKDARE